MTEAEQKIRDALRACSLQADTGLIDIARDVLANACNPEAIGAMLADASRLDWAMHKISGLEWRNIGVSYIAGCSREAIDAAIAKERT